MKNIAKTTYRKEAEEIFRQLLWMVKYGHENDLVDQVNKLQLVFVNKFPDPLDIAVTLPQADIHRPTFGFDLLCDATDEEFVLKTSRYCMLNNRLPYRKMTHFTYFYKKFGDLVLRTIHV